MGQMEQLEIRLRHGIADPVDVTLAPQEAAQLWPLPMVAVIDYLLQKSPHVNGYGAALRETLQDAQCVVEMRQGDLVTVVSRESIFGSQMATTDPTLREVEIGVAKTQAGGAGEVYFTLGAGLAGLANLPGLRESLPQN